MSEPRPATMRAWSVCRRGTPQEALRLETARPAPGAPTGADLLVRVTHAGLNPVDLPIMAIFGAWLPWRRRPVAGLDFAGEVLAAGPDAPPDLAGAGTPVCGALGVGPVLRGAGTLAEVITVPAHLAARRPPALRPAAAVAAGITGQTAAVLVAEVRPRPGDRVLVNGASGGVGSVLVPMLKARGAVVVGVCSGANAELVRRLGADEVVDYTAHRDTYGFLAERYGADDGAQQQLDVIVDCAGDDALYTRSPAYLAPAGRFLSIVGGRSQGAYPVLMHQLRPVWLGGTPRAFRMAGLAPAGALAREVVACAADGRLGEVPVDAEYAFEDVPAAYARLMTRRARGKIVIRVAG